MFLLKIGNDILWHWLSNLGCYWLYPDADRTVFLPFVAFSPSELAQGDSDIHRHIQWYVKVVNYKSPSRVWSYN